MKNNLETNSVNIWHLIIELEKALREHELEEGYKHVRVPINEFPNLEVLCEIEKRYVAAGWNTARAYTVTNPNQLGLILEKGKF